MRDNSVGKAGDTSQSGVGRSVEPIVGLAPRYAVRLALFFTALFMVAGTKLPYLPVWLQWRALSTSEIALIVAAPLFLRIFAGPMIAMAADRWGNRHHAAILLAGLALAGALLLSVAEGFWAILAVTLLGALASMGLMPIAETFAMSGVRRGGLDYGRMRLWGSISFIAVGFAAGSAITIYGPGSILALLVAGSVATFAIALVLPADPDANSSSAGRATIAAIAKAALMPRFLLFLLAAGAVQSSHAVFYTFGVIEWQRQGHSATWCATLWAVGVIAEIGVFAFSRSIAARLGAVGLLIAGAAAGVVRWAAMAFDPPLAMLLPLQALHGLTFGAAHLGALYFISAHVPPSEAATAQALYASVTAGIGMGLATLAAGPLYAGLGGQAYMLMAMFCIVGGLATVPLLRGRPDAGGR
jgi:MFS transporter, PPP family, 3-phenylpropionic acid transporter